jgi:hypothetical protein
MGGYIKAVTHAALGKTDDHSPNGLFVVTIVDEFFERLCMS